MTSSKVESILWSQLKDDLSNFSWDPLPTELSSNAPTLLKVLQGATKKRVPTLSTKAVICTVTLAGIWLASSVLACHFSESASSLVLMSSRERTHYIVYCINSGDL